MSEIITSTLPITVEKIGNDLIKNYQFYGQTGGIGVYDENLQSYKIPISVTNGQNVDNYSIDIGDSKLVNEEYLDYAEQKIYKRNPQGYIWIQKFFKRDNEQRVGYRVYWESNDIPFLTSLNGAGVIAVRGIPEIITHNTSGVTEARLTQEQLESFSGGNIQFRFRDLGEGVNVRTFITINGEYVYGPSFHFTYDEVIAAPNETIYVERPPLVLPKSASYPIITLNQGNNILSSSISNLEAYLEVSSGLISNVQVDNQNYNLIDSDFYSIIANNYSSTQIYSTGDYCIYNHCLYKCIVAITTPENFNSNKWQQAILTDII